MGSNYNKAANISQLKVLVVEDMAFDRELAVAILKKIGVHQVQTAENGSIAIGKIENAIAVRDPFDIVISDWKMPVQDGHGLSKWIKSIQEFKPQGLAVIITTSKLEESDVKEFIFEGVDAFVVKPLSKETLEKKILEVFGSKIKKAI